MGSGTCLASHVEPTPPYGKHTMIHLGIVNALSVGDLPGDEDNSDLLRLHNAVKPGEIPL